jgi:hypothetical protein
MVLLAKNGVPWTVTEKWSPARRLAALIIIGESNGGRFNWHSMHMEWPNS